MHQQKTNMNIMNINNKAAKYRVKKQQWKDLFFIFLGILLYSIGYTAFILPEKVVMGGVAGISALLYYAFKFPAGASIYILNATMLLIAFRALTKQFSIRTIIGVTIMAVLVGALQPILRHSQSSPQERTHSCTYSSEVRWQERALDLCSRTTVQPEAPISS